MSTATTGTALRVGITGATGMIGSELRLVLEHRGHGVVPISRRELPGGIRWDPAEGPVPAAQLAPLDVVVHLAGENLAEGRWTEQRKAALRASRVDSTRMLSLALASLAPHGAALVTASAVGYYGNRGEEELDEGSPPGTGFLATLTRDWEAAAAPAGEAGVRVAHCRLGVVLNRNGGALAKLLGPFRLGLGGPLGDGNQWMSWVAQADAVAAFVRVIEDRSLSGAFNVTAPTPVRNAEFAAALGQAVHRPAVIPVPAAVLHLMFGEMADEALLSSARVIPRRLLAAGFTFGFDDLAATLVHLIQGT